jgi:hypothetical protein
MLAKEDAGGLARPFAFCISVGQDSSKDATSAVVELLRDHDPPIRPASACQVSDSGDFRVTERATGKRAWFGHISALRFQNNRTVLAYSSSYVGPLFAAGWVCSFRKERDRWQADKCTLRWIS